MTDLYTVHIEEMRRRNPTILPVVSQGLYYLYFEAELLDYERTGSILMQCSKDLIHWSEPSVVFTAEGEFRGTPDIRSPKGYFYQGSFYLVASFRYESMNWNCQCFRAAEPEGPFHAIGGPLTMADDSAVDGVLHFDVRGRPWLIYTKLCKKTQDDLICAMPLSASMDESCDEEIMLFTASDAPWGQASLSEDGRNWRRSAKAPALHSFADGSLLMLWTGDSSVGSVVGCARSAFGGIHGPWLQCADPLYGMNGGGASLFEAFDARLIMSLHSPVEEGLERILLYEVEETDGQLKIINELTGNWYPNAYRTDGTMKVAK